MEKDTLHPHYNALYLAPHLDDVALSCGAQVSQRTHNGEKVLIVSITAGDPSPENLPPFAQAHHESWNLDARTVVADRRAEDARACKQMGADYAHLSILDAIYRRLGDDGAAFYDSDDTLFGAVNPAEAGLVDALVVQFATLPSADVIIAPLTVGGHVDHRLTRAAAEKAFGDVIYYEDYPYVQWNGLGDDVDDGWANELVVVSAEQLNTKTAAIAAYESQITHLFESDDDMRQRVTDYAQQIGGERLWRKLTT